MKAPRVLFGCLVTFVSAVFATELHAQSAGTALVRHAPALNGAVDGSLQQMTAESVTLNGGVSVTGDLLVPGTPTVRLNGTPTSYGGTIDGTGSISPSSYQVTLNGNVTLRHVIRRTNAVALPVVSAPPSPAGTRTVIINSASQSPGSFFTLRNLTLNGNVGQFAIPAGTYGNFSANGGSGFTLGVAGATSPAVYNFQNLTLNGVTQLQIIGPVIITVANGFTGNGSMGSTAHADWLTLNVYSGGFTLNGGCSLYGTVNAPNGTVIVNGNSQLIGGLACDRLIVNGGGLLRLAAAGGGNHAPVANNQAVSLNEDTPAAVTLTATDADGNPLTYAVVAAPAHGTLSGSAPNLTYTPAANFHGADSFTFKASDGQADSAVATVTLTIAAVNDRPTADAKSVALAEDTSANVILSGTDVDGDPLAFTVSAAPIHGALSGTPPNLIYTPAPNFNGADTFTYVASDGSLNSPAATVTITVTAVNDAPVANSASYSVNEGTTLPVLLTASDVDGNALTFAVLTSPTRGTLTGTAPNLGYQPNANFSGLDSFTFRASDGTADSAPATITIQVSNLNDPPVANNQAVATAEDTAASFTLTGSDPDGDAITYVVVAPPQHGTLTGAAPNLTYTPAANYNGADSFTFRTRDTSLVDSNLATVSIAITAVNDAPVAGDQAIATDEDTAIAVQLTATDVDNASLTYAVVAAPQHGTLTGAAPNLTYTPAANYNGADSFTFTANDGALDSAPATISLTVRPVNDAPVATAQTLTTAEDTPLALTLTGSDIEGSALTFAVATPPQHGTLTGTAPNLTYTPAPDYNGADSFTFTANDGALDSAAATVTLNVTPVNDAPVATGQDLSQEEDTPANFTLPATDIDGDALTYTIVTPPAHGTLSGTAPNLTYTPALHYHGPDALVFTASDGAASSAQATITFTVVAVSHAPVASDQSVTLAEDTSAVVTLGASDLDGDTLSYVVVTPPAHGSLSGTAPDLTYTPASNFNGTDSFAFKASDGSLDSNVATVSLTITPVNDAPTASAQSVTLVEDTPAPLTLVATDVDGDPLAYRIVTAPTHGTLSGTAPNLTYTPAANFAGTDSFTFRVNDATIDSGLATVSLTITPVNDAPVAAAQAVTTNEDTAVSILLGGTDADSPALTFALVTPPQHGTLSGTAPAFTYTPAPDYNGADSFTFVANDGSLDSLPATVALTVAPVNDAPIANPLTISTSSGSPTAIVLTGSDVDSATLTFAVLTPPQHGTLTGTPPNLTYTSNASFGGFDSLTFLANDGALNSAPATIQLFSGLPPRSRTYTTTADFNGGTLNFLSTDLPDQLTNKTVLSSFDVVWIANSSKGTVIKLDPETGRPLGEYLTTPEGVASPYPSRIAVDSKGNAWVANYSHDSIVKIGQPDNGYWTDRNHNGLTDTSGSLGDVKPWPGTDLSTAGDEAILLYIRTEISGVRHISVDADDNVWVGGASGSWQKFDGRTGAVLRTEPSIGVGGLGGFIASDGKLFSAGRQFLIWNTSNPTASLPQAAGIRGDTWEAALDSKGNLWCTRDGTPTVAEYAPNGDLLGEFYHGEPWAMGIAIDANDHVWIAHSHCGHSVGHLLPNGQLVGNVEVANHGPVEVSIDRHGRIWVASSTGVVERINPLGGPLGSDGVTPVGEVDVKSGNLGGALWTYGRFTGSTFGLSTPDGLWTTVYDGLLAGTTWGPAVWSGLICNDAQIQVEAALSADGTTYGPFQTLSLANPTPSGVGRYLKTRVRLVSATTGETPALYDLTVGTAGYTPPATTPSWDVSAGADIAGNWPDAIQLKGAFCHSVHAFPAEPAYAWSMVSGPGAVTFSNAAAKRPTAQFTAQGTYVLRLTATLGAEVSTDDVQVVLTPYNRAPYANAGYTTFIASFPPQIWLWGEVRDDGLPVGGAVTSTWSKLFGPGTVTFANPNAPSTTASFPVPGVYTLKLSATDTELASDNTTDVWIGVAPPPPPPSGLISWWAASGNGDDHISGNQAFLERGADYANGKLGGAFHFDGVNDRVRVFAAPGLDTGTQDGLTVELWVNPSVQRTATLFQYGLSATARGFQIRQVDRAIEVNFREAGGTDHILATANNALTVNTWTHVTASYSRTTGEARIFINGILQLVQNIGSFVLGTNYDVFMGERADLAEPYQGLLDEISVYNRAIYGDEVFTIVSLGKRPPVSNLPPVVSAGPDLFNQHVATPVALTGTVTDDGQPTNGALTITWSKQTGPGPVAFADPTSAATTATFTTPGVYVLNLHGDDGAFYTDDTVEVRVDALGTVETDASLAAWWPGNGADPDVVHGLKAERFHGAAFDAGEVEQGFAFDGSNDFARVDAAPALNLGAASAGFTIELWVKPGRTQDVPLVEWERLDGQQDGVSLWQNGSGTGLFAFIIDTLGNNHQISAGGVFAANTWAHVALTYDKVTGWARLYRNGILVAESNLGGFTPQTTFPVRFGTRQREGRYFQGVLDEISFYTRPLSIGEIAAICQIGSTGKNPPDNNASPVVAAGADLQVYAAAGTAVLNGTLSDDGHPTGSPVTATWHQVDGPGTASFGNAGSPATTATFSAPGTYVLRLDADDGFNQSTGDATVVRVGLTGTFETDGSLAAWWPGNGDPREIVHGNHDIEFYQGMGFGAGEVSQAFALDGANDHGRVPAHGDLNLGASPAGLTIELWVKPGRTQDTPLIEWERADGQQDGVSLWQNSSGTGFFAFLIDTAGANHQISAAGVFAANTWVHVAVTYDKVTGWTRLYRNGVLVAESNLGVFTPQTTLPIEFGTRRREGRFFQGALDEISFYTRPLTAGEIAAIYQTGTTGKNPLDGNAPPVVSAGPDVQVLSAAGAATLNGVVTDDGLPAGVPLTVTWSQVDGPGTATFANAHAAATTATFSAPGTYLLRLDANDGFNQAPGDTMIARVGLQGSVEADASLAAWWPGNGDPHEVVRGGHDIEFFQGMGYDVGEVSRAFALDGINDYGRVPAHSDLNIGASATGLTIELWVKPGRTQDTPLLEWERFDGGQDGVSLWQNSSGTGLFAFLIDTSGLNHQISAGGVFAANTWAHVAVTYDKATGWARLYRNGLIVAETNLGVFTPQTTLPIEFGTRRREGRFFQGALDEISFYTRPLTVAEIRAIYQAGATGKNPPDDNQPPVVNAGPDLQVLTASGTALLNGTVTDDGQPLGGTLTSTWTRVDGPGTVTFADASSPTTTATFGAAGTYVLRLDANDGFNQAAGDLMSVRVGLTGVVETDGTLAAWWPGNGDPHEVVHGNHDIEFFQGMGYGLGQVSQAFALDGIDDHGRVPAHSDLNVGASSAGLTIELWVKPGRTQDTPLIEWERADGQQDGVSLWQNSSGTGLFAFLIDTAGANHQISAGGVFTANTWAHVAVTYDKVTGWTRLYRNGVLVADSNLGTFTPQTTLPIEFGTRRREGRYFQGALDEISLYTRPLSAAEINAVYLAGATGKNPVDDNLPPVVDAGPDVQIFGAGDTAALNGVVSDDGKPVGGALTVTWSQVDGPGTATFANAHAAATTATFSAAGTYVLRLDANDGFNQAPGDTMVVRVANSATVEPDAALAAWWPANGDPHEVVRGGHDVEFFQGLGYGPGKVSEAFALDGANDYGRVPAHSDLNIGASAAGLTIELWVKPGRTQDTPLIEWERLDGQQDGVSFWQLNSGTGLYAFLTDTSGNNHQISAGGIFAANTWAHVTVTYDKITGWARLYRNGLIVAEANLGTFTPQTTLPIEIGTRRREGRFFQGALDEISFYTRPLSIAEVRATYLAGGTGKNPVDDNQPPAVSAGPDITLASATDTATLAGSVLDDGRPGTAAMVAAWSKVDGPGTVTFANAASPATTATFSAAGTYVLRLDATDGFNQAAGDTMVVRAGVTGQFTADGTLAAWWPGNGEPHEVIHGNHDLEFYQGLGYGAGQVSQGFAFDGVDDHGRVPAHGDLNIGTSAAGLTIELWVKPSRNQDTPLIEWERADGQQDGVSFWQLNSGTGLYAFLTDTAGGNHQISAGGVFTANSWAHVAVTYDKVTGVAVLYRNGTQVATANLGTFTPQTALPIEFGTRRREGRYFQGVLDEIGFYTRPLTAAEIGAIYSAGAAGKTAVAVNVAPTIVFTNPPSGSSYVVATPITLNAAAADTDGSVAKVEFFDGATKLGETLAADAGQPTSFTLPLGSGLATLGRHELTARVTDSAGAVVTSGLAVVNVAPVLPVVSLTSPANNANVPAGVAVTLQAAATYSLGALARVEFYDGALKLGESTAPVSGSTYAFTVGAGFGGGTHSLTAKAIAVDAAAATSAPATITATIVVPSVTLTAPTANTALTNGVALTLKADATYAAGPITKVEFYDGATKLGEATTVDPSTASTYSLVQPGGLSVGARTLAARVIAADGSIATSLPVPVSSTLAAPVVALTSPANGSTVVTAVPLTLVTTATQAVGTITKVEYFDGATKLGEKTSADAGNPSTYTFVASAGLTAGAHTLTAKATASNGATTTSAAVTVSTVTYNGPPVVEISTPADTARVSARTTVTGVVAHPALASWGLDYRLKAAEGASPEAWITLATGTNFVGTPADGSNPAVPGPLGTFDPTLLVNGIYELQLRMTDTGGSTIIDGPTSVLVEGNMKIGAFTLAFEDLKVSVAGLPITLTRTYDSRDTRVGDFGPGWRLALANIRVQKNRNLGTGWYQTPQAGSGLQFYYVDPTGDRIVTIVFPDGETHRFKIGAYVKNRVGDPDNASFAVVVTQGQIRFYPIGDTTSTLEPLDSSNQLADHFFIAGTGDQDITAEDPGSNPFAPAYNTTRFRLTTKDGTAYILDEALGLLSMTDLNGNTLTVGRDGANRVTGVTSTQNTPGGPVATSVTVHRDATGRVDYIRDPAGHDLDYGYDGSGRLASFTNRELNVTQFRYENASFPYYLTKVIDPRGVTALRTEFDADGRMVKQIDADGKETVFTHQLSGASTFEKVKDRLGHETTFYYDARGNVTLKIDPLGGQTSYTYDANDNQTSMTDPLGHTSTTTYDAHKNLLTQSDALGHTTTFTYNALSLPLTITDARGRVTTNAYDTKGNLTSTTDAAGNATTFVYDAAGRLTQVTDALGQVTTHTYNPAGHRASSTDPLGHTTAWTYDARGNRLTQTVTRTRADNSVVSETTTYTYDSEDRVTRTTFANGSFTEVSYNAFGKQASATDALGHVTSYTYDARGNLTTTTYPDNTTESVTFDAENRVVSTTDRAGHVTATSYDALGRATKVTAADSTFTSTAYDAAGRVTSTTDARGNVTTFGYDAAGRRTSVTDPLNQTTTYAYDTAGNVISFTDALNHTTSYGYDDRGLRTMVSLPDATTQLTSYDALGRKVSATDQGGKITRWRYDSAGRLIEVRQYLDPSLAPSDADYHLTSGTAGLVLTTYAYDEVGNRISQTDALGRTTRYAYDSLGRRVSRTLPGGQVESYAYDDDCNLTARTDFNGYTTSYVYDALNRLTEKRADATHPSLALAHAPAKYTYTYNALGQRVGTTVSNAASVSLYSETLAYDVRNRTTSRVTTNGTLSYAYDAQGNLASLHSNDLTAGVDVTYAYDQLNRLAQAAPRDPADGLRKATNYGYDAVGNLSLIASPNSVTAFYAYDALNRLQNLSLDRIGTLLASYTYTLDSAGHRTSVTELNARRHAYAYDALNRLTRETITAGSGDPALGGIIGYTLDDVGNRLARSSSVPGVAPSSGAYDVNDRLASDTYDANGNTRIGSPANGATMTSGDIYDFENRLIRRTATLNAQPATIDLTYDGDGRRVSETIGSQTITYLVDELNPTGYAQVLEERVNGALIRTYTYGHSLLSQTQSGLSGWVTSYYGYDGHGSTRLLTDASGVVTDTYAYDAFGVLLRRTNAASQPTFNRYFYTGQQYDEDLGLYYLRARYMNPASGRFWSMDNYEGARGDPASLHKYLYASSNPVDFSDPTGHWTLGEVLVTAGINATISGIISAAFHWNKTGADFWESVALDAGIGVIAVPVGGAIAKGLAPLAKIALAPLFRMIGELQPIVLTGGKNAVEKLLVNMSRFFLRTTSTYPSVESTMLGRILKMMFPAADWEMHHIAVQQAWTRAGSAAQFFGSDAAANEGLRRVANGGLNLVPIPAALNGLLGRSADATRLFAMAYYGTAAWGMSFVTSLFDDDDN